MTCYRAVFPMNQTQGFQVYSIIPVSLVLIIIAKVL